MNPLVENRVMYELMLHFAERNLQVSDWSEVEYFFGRARVYQEEYEILLQVEAEDTLLKRLGRHMAKRDTIPEYLEAEGW